MEEGGLNRRQRPVWMNRQEQSREDCSALDLMCMERIGPVVALDDSLAWTAGTL